MFEKPRKDEPEHVTVAHTLQKYLIKAKLEKKCFPIKFPALNPRPLSTQQSPTTTSKLLPLICPKTAPRDKTVPAVSNSAVFQKICKIAQSQHVMTIANECLSSLIDNQMPQSHKFHAAGAASYIPVQRCIPHQRIAPPVTIRNAIPVFSAPPLPSTQSSMGARPPVLRMPPPVRVRQAVPVSATSPDHMEELPHIHPSVKVESPQYSRPPPARVEQPPLSRADSGRLGDSPFFKLPMVRVEEPLGPKLLPVHLAPFSEVPALQLEPPSFEVPRVQIQSPVSSSISSSTSTKASINEIRISVQDTLQESSEIKALIELKI